MNTTWKDISPERRKALLDLLQMEAEGGGWIPIELFEEDPDEAREQVAAIQAAIQALRKAVE